MNNWHHLVGVREGDYIRFYLNGTLANSTFVGSATINNVANQHMLIGRTGAGNYTNAGFDELAIYNRALSAAEVGELFGLGCGDFDVAGEELVEGYRYGFNGMEKDDEVKGSGNSYDFGNRMQDPRLGRFLSLDRFANKFPSQSPYSFAGNMPIAAIDAKGDSVELVIGRPYSKNGKENPYGHMAVRVFNSEEGYDYVFDFGRYGETWGLLSSEGNGILNVYTNGDAYMRNEQTMRNSVGYMKPTTVTQDQAVIDYFMKQANDGEKYKSGAVPGGGGTAYKLNSDYHWKNNNCCTQSLPHAKIKY